jgi:hypothetical protein
MTVTYGASLVPKISELGAPRCAHNPKVAGSNPAPAITYLLVVKPKY